MAEDLVTVATFQTLPEAEAARLRLESEGFEVYLTDAELVNMDWMLGNAIGYIKIQVPQARAMEAAESIVRMREEQAARVDDPRRDNVCLSCGAPFAENATACAACGWSFGAGEEEE